MIQDILQNSKENKLIVGFNYYSSSNEFYCGYVLEFTDDFVVIQHYSKFGISDGVLVHKISDIEYFETETVYLHGITLLIQKQSEFLEQKFSIINNKAVGEGFTDLFESFIGNKEFLIKFELSNDEIYFGFIEWCDENNFSIINIDSDGMIIGKAIFKFQDLKLYWIDDLESRKRIFLYNDKYVIDY